MKKIRFVFLVIQVFVFSNIFGQIKEFSNYQKFVNTAQLNIIAGNKIEALGIYYNLLTSSDGNFSRDIYSSLMLATELNRIDTFFVLLDLVKKKNFDNEYLNGLPEFSDLHDHIKWQTFINSNNKTIYIDTALRSEINNLYKRDQYFRIKDGSYEVYGDTIRKIDSLNIDYLIKLISKKGLPGEKEIGAMDFSGGQGYDIVLHHHSQNRSRNKTLINLTPILINQVLEGRIEPNKCSHYLEMQNGEFKGGVFDLFRCKFGEKYSGILVPYYSPNEKYLIDEYRKWICLEPLEDYYKKVKFVIFNRENKYKFDVVLNVFVANSEKDFFQMQKGCIEIK